MTVDNIELMDCEVMRPYHCPSCSRCFLACGQAVAGDILCMCGGQLAEQPLPSGIYELKSEVAAHMRATNPGGAPSQRAKEQERDLGYGASHGHAPGHEGPTGPGDAPADTATR